MQLVITLKLKLLVHQLLLLFLLLLLLQELSFHYSLHTSLDVVEEKLAAGSKIAGSDQRELYLGALNSSEHQKVHEILRRRRPKSCRCLAM